MKITILASEAVPFAKTGGLADAVTALAKQLVKLDHNVTLMMPMYSGVSMALTEVIKPLTFALAGRKVTYSLVEGNYEEIKLVFVDAPVYFHRSGIYGDAHGGYADNDERFTFFTRACLDYYHRKNEQPDIFHCNDWQTALLPLFLRTHYLNHPLNATPVLLTVHNMAYQGVFSKDRFGLLEVSWQYFTSEGLEFHDQINFLKGGLVYSDVISTVSRRYSLEIQTPEYGYGLEGVLSRRSDRLFGILNGIDEEIWNPEKDPLIAKNYSIKNLRGKAVCRKELLSEAGWDVNSSRPIIGIISRLVAQKGFDLLEASIERILGMNTFLVVLGSGEARYERFFEAMHHLYPQQVAIAIKYDNVLAHKIEAGADMFLMPSRYEPCGLNQMYSLKYGTVPIVRATGGLDDTVQQWDFHHKTGNGFKFYDYSAQALLGAVWYACQIFEDKEDWKKLMKNGMRGDYSWKNPALQYVELYQKAIELKS